MIHVTKDREKVVQQSSGRPYNTPRLFMYGAVRELTMSGSTGKTEKGSSTNNPSKQRP
jgi:hypothetical protein